MEDFVDSFIEALGLDRSYSMLVINPKWSPSLPSYSYRIGFSEAELRLLHEQVRAALYGSALSRRWKAARQSSRRGYTLRCCHIAFLNSLCQRACPQAATPVTGPYAGRTSTPEPCRQAPSRHDKCGACYTVYTLCWVAVQVNLPELQPGGANHLGAEPEPPQYGGTAFNTWPFSISKLTVSCRRYRKAGLWICGLSGLY